MSAKTRYPFNPFNGFAHISISSPQSFLLMKPLTFSSN